MDHVPYWLLATLAVCYIIHICVNSKKKCKPSSGIQGKTPGEHGSEPMSHSMNPGNDPHTALTVDNPTDQPQNMHKSNKYQCSENKQPMCNSSARGVSEQEVTNPPQCITESPRYVTESSRFISYPLTNNTQSSGEVAESSEVHLSNKGSTAPYGLSNQGQTCYLNSVLQVLFNTKEMHEALKKTEKGLNDTDRVLKDLFKNLKKRACETKTITDHLQIINVYKQRDAREHLELLLNRMSPAVSKPFLGEQLYKTTCSEEHCIIEEPYPFWTLPLTLSQGSSVQESLNDMGKSKDFSFYCPECEGDTTVTRVCEMTKPPEILTLLLKWSHNDQHTIYNYSNEVVVTVRQVEKESVHVQRVLYSLCGVVDHSGSRRGGHYTATLLNSDDRHWYCFNDSYVHKVGWQDDGVNHRSSDAYMLIYRISSMTEDPDSENKIPSNRHRQIKHGFLMETSL